MDRSKLPSSSTMTNNICNDIIVEILSWLPVDSLLRFKSVSKSWFSLITDPKFAKLHSHHYSLTATTQIHNPTIMFSSPTHYSLKSMDKVVSSSSTTVLEKMKMVYPFDPKKYSFYIEGSCNGLMCISMISTARYDGKTILCLWNPSTNDFKQLPSHENDDAPPYVKGRKITKERKVAIYGFGYDHVMEDYKVIVSVQWYGKVEFRDEDETDEDEDVMDDMDYYDEDVMDDMYHYELKVYTLGTDSWRRIEGTPYEHHRHVNITWSPVNGALHWIADSYKSRTIISFDIVEEMCREVTIPRCFFGSKFYKRELSVLRGCLCLCACERLSTKEGFMTEVWMLMNYGMNESWTKLFNITNVVVDSCRLKPPVWFGRNGKLLMESGSRLVIYDTKHNEARLLKKPHCLQTHIYIASLVSLKSQKEIEKDLIIC